MFLTRVQMEQGIMNLLHKHIALCFTEICVIVATELVIAVDEVSDLVHHPLYLFHRAHLVSIAIHDSQGYMTNFMQWDVRGHPLTLIMLIRLRKLLEAPLDAILEEVHERARRERVLMPSAVLFAPFAAEMRTDLRFVNLPIVAVKTVQSDHIDLRHKVTIVFVSC